MCCRADLCGLGPHRKNVQNIHRQFQTACLAFAIKLFFGVSDTSVARLREIIIRASPSASAWSSWIISFKCWGCGGFPAERSKQEQEHLQTKAACLWGKCQCTAERCEGEILQPVAIPCPQPLSSTTITLARYQQMPATNPTAALPPCVTRLVTCCGWVCEMNGYVENAFFHQTWNV